VDCVHFGDDWGAQKGLLIGLDMWREFIKPRFKQTCEAAKRAGLFISHHSCGKVESLFPDLVECGVDVFDPFQPEVMDILQLRQHYRNQLAFWGGLSVQQTLPHGTPEDVRRESRRLLQELGPGGGYIISPSHSITGDVPVENILAFLDVVQHQSETTKSRGQ
jgi:uroporphyrinogen decarboxylase